MTEQPKMSPLFTVLITEDGGVAMQINEEGMPKKPDGVMNLMTAVFGTLAKFYGEKSRIIKPDLQIVPPNVTGGKE